MERGEYKKCPECEKSVKHLVPHLKNKHKLRTANFKEGVKGLEKTESDPTHPTTPEPVKMDADFKDGAKELENNSDISMESFMKKNLLNFPNFLSS